MREYIYASLAKRRDELVESGGTHLGMFSNTVVAVVAGFRAFAMRYYGNDLVTWTPTRTIVTWTWRGSATKARINHVLEGRGMRLEVFFGEWILHTKNGRYVAKSGMRITNDGRVLGAGNYDKWWAKHKEPYMTNRRTGARLRYWRGMRNRPASAKVIKHDRLTVKGIMAEPNTTIRMAKARVYGIDRFLTDAGSTVVNAEAGYELLRFSLGLSERERWNSQTGKQERVEEFIQALRMTCPSTKETYIETVPPNVATVREALDWRYNMTGYLDKVGQQT